MEIVTIAPVDNQRLSPLTCRAPPAPSPSPAHRLILLAHLGIAQNTESGTDNDSPRSDSLPFGLSYATDRNTVMTQARMVKCDDYGMCFPRQQE